jgi:hypothetical protein
MPENEPNCVNVDIWAISRKKLKVLFALTVLFFQAMLRQEKERKTDYKC